MIWEMGMLATLLEHYLVICSLCDGRSEESQTLEELNSTGQNYEAVGPEVNAHDSLNKHIKNATCFTSHYINYMGSEKIIC